MKTIKYMGMALIMAALASCSSDDDFGTNWQNDPTAVPQVEQRVYDVHRPLSKRKRRFYCTKKSGWY